MGTLSAFSRVTGRPVLLGLAAVLAGCAALPPVQPSTPPLVGQLELVASRQVAATTAEIGLAATVSLIDPVTGNTLATTLSSPTGGFSLSFDGTFTPAVGPYVLEAVKGLSAGGSANRAGASLARMRTLISYQGGWTSMTGQSLVLGTSSTALCALSGLKGLTNAENLALIGTVAARQPSVSSEGLASPDTFAGTPQIDVTTYHRGRDLVARAIAQNQDPIASLFLRPAAATSSADPVAGLGLSVHAGIGLAASGWKLSSVTPATVPAASGGTVTVRGVGLPAATDSATASVNGVNCPVTAASADGTALTLQVPSGIALGSYLMTIQYGPWTNQALSLTIN